MAKRDFVPMDKSKKLFSKTSGTHPKNGMRPSPMRGGIRL